MLETPVDTVRKITGPMAMRIRLRKMSPNGFIASAVLGANRPRITPITIATRTWSAGSA